MVGIDHSEPGGSFGQGSRIFWPKDEPFSSRFAHFWAFPAHVVHQYNEER
jgi:hypothetical protein